MAGLQSILTSSEPHTDTGCGADSLNSNTETSDGQLGIEQSFS